MTWFRMLLQCRYIGSLRRLRATVRCISCCSIRFIGIRLSTESASILIRMRPVRTLGCAISLVGPADWKKLSQIEKMIGQKVKREVVDGLEPTSGEPSTTSRAKRNTKPRRKFSRSAKSASPRKSGSWRKAQSGSKQSKSFRVRKAAWGRSSTAVTLPMWLLCCPIKQVDNRNKSAKAIENKNVMGRIKCVLDCNSSLDCTFVHLTFNQVVAGSILARPTNKSKT